MERVQSAGGSRSVTHLPARTGTTPPDSRRRVGGWRAGALGLPLFVGVWLLLSAEALGAQELPTSDRSEGETDAWAPMRLLVGTWQAGIDGRLGQGSGLRRYQFIFDGMYLLSRHASVRLPQEASPEGDHHPELAVYSYDRERGVVVLREFMGEGFVLRSSCETEPMRFVCTSEEVESGSGMRSRLTVEMTDAYHFSETFELASPGQELDVYFTNTWTRVPDIWSPW